MTRSEFYKEKNDVPIDHTHRLNLEFYLVKTLNYSQRSYNFISKLTRILTMLYIQREMPQTQATQLERESTLNF